MRQSEYVNLCHRVGVGIDRKVAGDSMAENRFGEGLRLTADRLNAKNFHAFNPAFDK